MVTVDNYNLKYDSKGNLIYCKHEENSDGYEEPAEEFFFEYDGKGNKIYGKYFTKHYDGKKRCWEIRKRICHFEYDDRGNLIHVTRSSELKNHDSITSKYSYQYEFDNDGKLLCRKLDYEDIHYGYDCNGNIVHVNGVLPEFIPCYNFSVYGSSSIHDYFYEYEFYDDGIR